MTFNHTRWDQLHANWLEYHKRNPEVWEAFVKFSFEAINRGFTKYGADAVLQRIRWETRAGDGKPRLKISNNHSTFYARHFTIRFPEYEDFFVFKEQTSRRKPAHTIAEYIPSEKNS